MKRQIRFSSAIIGFAFLTTAVSSWGQIAGSMHDFSTRAWNTTTEMCIVCHTPHHADVSVQDAPLWNHEVTTATFTVYSSATMNATPGQPSGLSALCLSCHDGTVALDSFGGATGSTSISGNALVGINLRNDHPVSVNLNTAVTNGDTELQVPTGATQLFSGNVECASCHDAHDNTNGYFLRGSNANSALCVDCHTK